MARDAVLQKKPKEINNEMQKAAKAYIRMSTLRDRSTKGAFVADIEINRMIREMIKTYSDTIAAYNTLAEEEKEHSPEINWMLEAAAQQSDDYLFQNRDLHASVKKNAARAGANLDAEEDQEEKGEWEPREDQKQGLRDIAKWLYRNTLRQGNFDWIFNVAVKLGKFARDRNFDSDKSFTSYDRHSYVDQIMQKSEQEKLLIYYLVENKKTSGASVEPEDIKASQTSYVPNIDNFKNRMIATRFKFWKRFTGSEIYWEKLGTAAQLAAENSMYLAAYADFQVASEDAAEAEAERETEKEKQDMEEAIAGEGTEKASVSPEQAEDSSVEVAEKNLTEDENTAADVIDLEQLQSDGKKRYELLKEFQGMILEYQTLVAKRDDIVSGTEEYKAHNAAIKTTEKALQAKLKELVAANDRLPEAKKAIDAFKASSGDNIGQNNIGADSNANKAVKFTGFGSLGAGSIGGNVMGAAPNASMFIKMDLTALSAINIVSGALGSLGALSKFASCISMIVSLVERADIQTDAENSEQKWRIARGFAEGTSMAGTAASRIALSVEKASNTLKEATNQMKDVLGTGTQILAGVGMVTEAITFMESVNRYDNSVKTEKALENVRKAKTNRREKEGKTQLSENERREDLLDDRLNMKNNQKKRSAMLDMVGSSISFMGNYITVLGPLSPIGMVISMLGTGIKVIGTLWNMWENMSGKKETVYKFFGIYEAYDELLLTVMPSRRSAIEQNKDAVMDELRHMILAKLNLFSVSQGYFYAVRKMAELLYFNTFYKDDRNTLITREEVEKDPKYSHVKEEYIPRVESLGFKADFPEKKEDSGYPRITIDMLMVKLQ